MGRNTEFRQLMTPHVPEKLIEFCIEQGFTVAPASTRFHGAYDGGLYDHSKAVMNRLLELTDKLGLQWEDERSPYIVGMFHDLCKIDGYVKEGGKWSFNYKQANREHGNKSLIILKYFMELTEEEELAVRYHMGAYEKKDWSEFDRAIRMYETVLYTHTADMLASKVDGV